MSNIMELTESDKTICMQDSLIDKLEYLAAKNNVSFNQLVVQCCEYSLNHLIQSDNIKKCSEH